MAEMSITSTRICKKILWEIGDCVSVPPLFFGKNYAAAIPESVTKIIGRVKQVFTGRLLVTWDADRTENMVYFQNVEQERRDTEIQVLSDNTESIITASEVESFSDLLGERVHAVEPGKVKQEPEIDLVVQKLQRVREESVITEEDFQSTDQSTSSSGNNIEIGNDPAIQSTSSLPTRTCKPTNFSYESEIDTSSEEEGSLQRLKTLRPGKGKGKSEQNTSASKPCEQSTGKKRKQCGNSILQREAATCNEDEPLNKKKKTSFQLRVKPAKTNSKRNDKKSQVHDEAINIDDTGTLPLSDEDIDTTDSEEDEVEEGDKGKISEQKKVWQSGGWRINPDTSFPYGPKLNLDDPSSKDELAFFIHFLPMNYIREELIPATNEYAKNNCRYGQT